MQKNDQDTKNKFTSYMKRVSRQLLISKLSKNTKLLGVLKMIYQKL